MEEKKLFLLDALALIFRAYYALIRNPRITTKGKNTNAQFGFTNTIVELINNQSPPTWPCVSIPQPPRNGTPTL